MNQPGVPVFGFFKHLGLRLSFNNTWLITIYSYTAIAKTPVTLNLVSPKNNIVKHNIFMLNFAFKCGIVNLVFSYCITDMQRSFFLHGLQ
jgi:hypothetical protein